MKILHITDSHGTVKSPESRKDIYYISFLKKLYELGYAIRKHKIDMVVHTGDLFHTARVSDKFAGQVIEQLRAWQVPIYVVPGNHDIEGYTIDTIDQTKLGLLAKSGVVQLLDRENPVIINAQRASDGQSFEIALSGQEYYAHIDEGNMDDFEMQQDEADFNILAIHGFISDSPQHPNVKHTLTKDIVTDADVILAGHNHMRFEYSGPDVDIFNPGSMMRVDQTSYNKNHVPGYGILEVNLTDQGDIEYDYTIHNFITALPSDQIFDYATKQAKRIGQITLDKFKASISNTVYTNSSSNIIKIIDDICTSNPDVDPVVHQEAMKAYNNALQNVDSFDVKQGYIPSNTRKKIKKVKIHNFQSHKDTEIDFEEGLNIIVGESNNGKTSIMRAIMWAIDNQPLGTDFIMAGQDECKVTICFDDGTSITRGRTKKDTGYYDVYYHDDNGTLQRANYRGFTNAVPVEVDNVHQMPKVSITKDIETHLNVLTQLERPFLLTESPLVKASAIGRITGTHIIDSAIKEGSKTIQSNSKLIKAYQDDLVQKENELNALPDTSRQEKLVQCFEAALDKVKSLQKDITEINFLMSNIESRNQEIDKTQRSLKKTASLVKALPKVNAAMQTLSECNSINRQSNDYLNIQNDIIHYQERIKKFKSLSEMTSVVSNALELLQCIDRIQNCFNELYLNQENAKQVNSLLSSWVKHKGILLNCISYVKNLIYQISNMENDMNKIHELDEKIAIDSNHVFQLNSMVTSLQEEYQNALEEQRSEVLKLGICPCCNQKITEEHLDAVLKFTKKNKIGDEE